MNLERNWRQYNYTRELSTLLTSLHRPSRKKINKKTMKLNDILNQICLIDIEHCIQKQNTNSQKHMGTFSRTDHISGHKPNLTKFKKTEIMSSTFSDYSAMKLEHNHKKKKKREKNTKTWRLKNSQLNNQWVTKESKKK